MTVLENDPYRLYDECEIKHEGMTNDPTAKYYVKLVESPDCTKHCVPENDIHSEECIKTPYKTWVKIVDRFGRELGRFRQIDAV